MSTEAPLVAAIWSWIVTASIAAAVLMPAAWLACRAFSRKAPAVRHQVWFYVMLAFVFLPLLRVGGPKVPLAVLPASSPVMPSTSARVAVQRPNAHPVAGVGFVPRPERASAAGAHATSSTTVRPPATSVSWPFVLVGVWVAGLLWMLTRLALGALRLGALRRRARPASSPDMPQGHTTGRAPLLLSDEIEGPAACGLLRPVIVLPRRLIETADPHALDMILKHEHAHIRRRDHMTIIFQRLAEAALFFHPCVWYASKELTRERELVCDQHAVQGGSRTQYVKLLAGMIERGWGRPSAQAMALFEGSLLTRVRSLLEGRHEGAPELSRRARAVSAVAAAVIVLALGTLRLEARSTQAPSSTAVAAGQQTPADVAKAALGPIGYAIRQYRFLHGEYPPTLDDLGAALPANPDGSLGQQLQYEPSRTSFVLSNAGADGRPGNDDDGVLYFSEGTGSHYGSRAEIYPLPESDPDAQVEVQVPGRKLPAGTASISGRVVSADDGQPLGTAMVYLFYAGNLSPRYVRVARDGSFHFNNIAAGRYSLRTMKTAGFQDAAYDPDARGMFLPLFTLADGQKLENVVFELKPSVSLSGRIVGDHPEALEVLAVTPPSPDSTQLEVAGQARPDADGQYRIDALSEQPVYIMVADWQRTPADGGYCPQYYPGTYSRDEAELVTFGSGDDRADVNLTLRRTPGMVLEGTVRDQAGKPVSGAFVVAHGTDSTFDIVSTYTDERGHYRISCLGAGSFSVHVDARQDNLVRRRAVADINESSGGAQLDFVLPQGVTIAGKLVDEQGRPWSVGSSYGVARVAEAPEADYSFGIGLPANKNLGTNAREDSSSGFDLGEGNSDPAEMIFPTEDAFLIEGVAPGHTSLDFSPKRDGKVVKRILYNGADVTKTGIETTEGQKLPGVVIVIGDKS